MSCSSAPCSRRSIGAERCSSRRWAGRILLRSSTAWERVGAGASPGFCGVLIVEASKELMAPIGRPAKARRLRQLVPSASPARRDRA